MPRMGADDAVRIAKRSVHINVSMRRVTVDGSIFEKFNRLRQSCLLSKRCQSFNKNVRAGFTGNRKKQRLAPTVAYKKHFTFYFKTLKRCMAPLLARRVPITLGTPVRVPRPCRGCVRIGKQCVAH